MVEGLTKAAVSDKYDLVIIGGGYVGAWLGYYSSKYYPQWSTLIIDKDKFGSGVSYYGADLDFPNNKTAEHKALSLESRSLINEALTTITDLPFSRSFAYVVTSMASSIEELSRYFGESKFTVTGSNSISMSNYKLRINKAELILDNVDIVRAFDKTAIQKLLAAAKENNPNIHFREKEEVVAVSNEKNKREVILRNGSIKAERIISAIGPWSVDASWLKEIEIKIRVKKVVAFHLTIKPRQDDKVIYMLNNDAFFMPQPESERWLLSISSKEWDCKPDAGNLTISREDIEIAKTILNKYIPDTLPRLSEGSVFCDAYSDQRCPVVVPLSNDNNFLFVGGCSGSGFRLSPAIAHRAIRMLAN